MTIGDSNFVNWLLSTGSHLHGFKYDICGHVNILMFDTGSVRLHRVYSF